MPTWHIGWLLHRKKQFQQRLSTAGISGAACRLRQALTLQLFVAERLLPGLDLHLARLGGRRGVAARHAAPRLGCTAEGESSASSNRVEDPTASSTQSFHTAWRSSSCQKGVEQGCCHQLSQLGRPAGAQLAGQAPRWWTRRRQASKHQLPHQWPEPRITGILGPRTRLSQESGARLAARCAVGRLLLLAQRVGQAAAAAGRCAAAHRREDTQRHCG